jgi:DNA polymerase-3 subunit alpha
MIHLNGKTSYSFMRGYGSPEDWLRRCVEIDAPALAVADYCSTWGHVPFRAAAKGTGVSILYGVTLPVVEALEKDPRHALVVLLARQDVKSLYDLVTLAHEQTYYRPRIQWSQIPDDLEVILVSGKGVDIQAFERFGRGYLGVYPTRGTASFAAEEFNCVPIASPVYPYPNQRQGYELVQAISEKQRIGEAIVGGNHLLRKDELNALYDAAGIQWKEEWYDNAENVVQACTAQIHTATPIKVEGDLVALAERGLQCRGFSTDVKYRQRLEEELKLIKEKGFEDYFIFVADVVNWAKERMFVGPGRGSVGGCLVAYALGISDVDPISHGTRFDRFIDPGRSDLPDIDVDFPDNRRDEDISKTSTDENTSRESGHFPYLEENPHLTTRGARWESTELPFDPQEKQAKVMTRWNNSFSLSKVPISLNKPLRLNNPYSWKGRLDIMVSTPQECVLPIDQLQITVQWVEKE